MKTITEIRNEKPLYYVCVNGSNEFESYSIKECKNWLADFLKECKHCCLEIEDSYNYYIGMYSITIE